MITTYIALGSNLRDPLQQLRAACVAIGALPGSQITRISSVYRSAAVGPGEQPDYLNAALALDTALSPQDLLTGLQAIEQSQGRVRDQRWGARTLDLDILLYDDLQSRSPALSLPHPRMDQRNFVLYPLLEITAENLLLPDGRELGTLVADCARGDLVQTDLTLHVADSKEAPNGGK